MYIKNVLLLTMFVPTLRIYKLTPIPTPPITWLVMEKWM